MSVSKWFALGAIAALSLASSTTFAEAPKKAHVQKPSEVVIGVESLPDAKPEAKKSRPVVASPSSAPATTDERSKARAQSDDEHARIEPAPPAPPAPPQPPPAPPQPAPPQPAPLAPPQPTASEAKRDPAEANETKDTKGTKGGAGPLALNAPKLDDADDANTNEAGVEHGKLSIRPYLLLSGGVKADFVKTKPREVKDNRVSTFALARIGLRATWLDFVYVESELMASGGVGLHGTSAYEGQAAMQVRQQMIRLSKAGFRVEVGRMIDEASVDFYSAHVAETFLQDTAVRDPLLFSGFNLGNGIRASYEIIPGLRAALTFNAGNPVSNTASLLVGGGYPPHERFYTQPYVAVGQSANNFPDDTFHTMIVTPSILVDTKHLDVRVAVQGFDIDPNMASNTNDDIRGYNVRGTARAKLLGGLLIPFASSAYTRNDTLVQTNVADRARERYHAVNLGAGVDVDLARRFHCSYDCADGFGAQYQQVQYQIGEGLVTTQRYINVGATYWLAPNVSLGARFAMWMQEAEQPVGTPAALAGQRVPNVNAGGERSGILAVRFIIP